MVAAARDQGKTAFVKDALSRDNLLNAEGVRTAWTESGRAGSISTTLVQKVRSEMGLTGNLRLGRKPGSSNGSANGAAAAPKRRGRKPGSKTTVVGVPEKTNGRHAHEVQVVVTELRDGARTRVLTTLEGDIDEMIFAVKDVGGLPEFEETLRKARRILARNHAE